MKRTELRPIQRMLIAVVVFIAFITWVGKPAHASGVYINSPSHGATVSGTAGIVTTVDSNVVWIDVSIDSKPFAVSPPFTFSWNTTAVGNGNHTIAAVAFSKSGTNLGTASATVNVANGPADFPGNSYYVGAGGKDSNPGTSSSAPWATLNRVNSASFLPGDKVYFKAGGWWRGTLQPPRGGIPGAPITFTSYGTGPARDQRCGRRYGMESWCRIYLRRATKPSAWERFREWGPELGLETGVVGVRNASR